MAEIHYSDYVDSKRSLDDRLGHSAESADEAFSALGYTNGREFQMECIQEAGDLELGTALAVGICSGIEIARTQRDEKAQVDEEPVI
jgi:hypothetical protein